MQKNMQLAIPKPCSEDWEKMTPTEKGRFCASCSKEVVDFTGMSPQELISYFRKSGKGRVCGRLNQAQLNTPIGVPPKRIPWLRYFFQVTIPLMLAGMKAQKTAAQTCSRTTQVAAVKNVLLGDTVITPEPIQPNLPGGTEEMRTVTGSVFNETGAPMPGASVVLKGSNRGAFTDQQGSFVLNVTDSNSGVLVFSFVGYETQEVPIRDPSVPVEVHFTESDLAVAGDVVVIVGKISSKPAPPIPIIPEKLPDQTMVPVFPNPVRSGGLVTIDWQPATGNTFTVELLSPSGQVVLRRKVADSESAGPWRLQLPYLPGGVYMIRIIGKEEGVVRHAWLVIE